MLIESLQEWSYPHADSVSNTLGSLYRGLSLTREGIAHTRYRYPSAVRDMAKVDSRIHEDDTTGVRLIHKTVYGFLTAPVMPVLFRVV